MPTRNTYELIRSGILTKLERDLSKELLYHCVDHTIDVEKQAERIAISERIDSEEDLFLLKVACLYHDSGFLSTYSEHEAAGCHLAKMELPGFGLSVEQVDIICGLIRATKIPQTPLSKLEEIICDADLDYLGRNDFFDISNNLFLELKAKGIITTLNDWNSIQVKFFKRHEYFTTTTLQLRQQQKLAHLQVIEAMIEEPSPKN